MKSIGIIGGLGPESTIACYGEITREYFHRRADYNYPQIIMHSPPFQEFIDRGYDLPDRVRGIIRLLGCGGADFVIAPCNSLHLVWKQLKGRSSLPWLSIMDAVAARVKSRGLEKVALLGTVFTMEGKFFEPVLEEAGIEVLLPEAAERQVINDIIYRELVRAEVRPSSRDRVKLIIDRLAGRGARGVVLACTELPFLFRPGDISIEVFDTVKILSHYALDYALNDQLPVEG